MKLLPIPGLLAALTLALHAEEPAPAKPAEKPAPGHSMHGEAFNEGPRQAAVLMPGMGGVHFPITTTSPRAQKFFDQGVSQVHGFWYFEAERSFRQAAALDADCAMAYWGMAMANINNPKRAADFMKEADKRKAALGDREKRWIDAFAAYYSADKKEEKEKREALVRALEDISYDYEDDIEAKSFLVFQMWDNKQHGVPLTSRRAVDALADEVLKVQPMHPGIHHYRIHLWNTTGGDKRALDAAAACGQAAPGIAHLWHMPAHTYSNLRRYEEAAWQQDAAARTDHAYMISARILPDQIHNFAHNNDWLVKNLGYVGRVHDAVDLAKNMVELPRLPSRDSGSYNLGRERLVEMLLRFELWDEMLALEGSIYLTPRDKPLDEVGRLRALGVAAFAKGDRAKADAKLAALEASLKKAREDRAAAGEAAESKATEEKKTEEQIGKAMADALRKLRPPIDAREGALAELRLYRALADGKLDDAKAQMPKTRDISSERQARLWLQIGDKEKAEKLAREATEKDARQQVQPLANLAWVLWQLDKKDEAKKTFEKLRALSGQTDLDVPAFARLEPIARDIGVPADWRVAAKLADDVGERPSLDSLGPFRWHPYDAPEWSLPDGDGKPRSLADYRGKPVLVVFYLGSGCSHCIEQLNVFGPMAKEFGEAGISIVAVSTDTAADLQRTLSQAKDGAGFPFPIVADPEFAAFKAYRTFDDFEHIPLHGTFLIDGAGRVRWQDISYQPFRDAKWLLGECKRLLSVPVSGAKATASH